MTESRRPSPFAFVLAALRLEAGVSQTDLARLNGISGNLLSLYENDKKPMSRERLEALVAPLGAGSDVVEETLLYLDALRGERFAPEPLESPFQLSPSERRRLRRAAATVARDTLLATFETLARDQRSRLAAAVMARAEVSWRRLRRAPTGERRALVEAEEEYRTWGVSVLAGEASAAAAARKPPLALELAELARFVAERVGGSDVWRARVQGRAWAFVGNARRVGNDLAGADRAFVTAWALWKAGAAADPGVLDASRLPDLEASLRRDQRRWGEALALLDQALAASPNTERSARILVKKGSTHIQHGEYLKALAVLEQAAPLADPVRDPRLIFGLRYNLAVSLCNLGRYSDAVPRLAEARELAFDLRNSLDFVRIVWLEAKVSAGLGHRDEAIAALRQVQAAFAAHRLPADAALAALELAVLLLEERRTREVRELAVEMLPIFASLRFGEEVLAALRLFWEAVEQEGATAELGRRLLAYLERARYDPDLRFETPRLSATAVEPSASS
jgi:transcriptional regulator with XRE-family HTH domain